MNKTMVVMFLITLSVAGLAWYKDPPLVWQGVRAAGKTFKGIAPMMVMGFLLGGLLTAMMPKDFLASYVGENSGWLGLVIATAAGSISPGGPFIAFPIASALWKAGTSVGPLVAYLTSWSLLGMQRVFVYEAPIMGWRFTTVRLACSALIPILLGYITNWLWRRFY